jgi:hypothetical protein
MYALTPTRKYARKTLATLAFHGLNSVESVLCNLHTVNTEVMTRG